MKFKAFPLGLIFVILSSYLINKPLFISGFFPMHDDTQPSRIYEMKQSLKDGMFPVRWVQDLGYGYGYPIFNYYGPFAYYLGGIISNFGFEILLTTKIVMALGMIIAGISMYFLAKEFWGETGGVISGLLYLYAPYHALNLYVRGDVAEIYAYAFVPLVFLGLYKIMNIFSDKSQDQDLLITKVYTNKSHQKNEFIKKNKLWFYIAIGSVSYALVIISHNLTALMITPYLFLVIFLSAIAFYLTKQKLISIKYLFFTLLLGISISAFYWLPALTEMNYTNVLSQIGGKADYKLHFVCLKQLWDSPWGFGGSIDGCIDGMSFRVGKLHILLTILITLIIPFVWKRYKLISSLIMGVLGLTLISIWLTTQYSESVWSIVPLMKFFQYPWRFLLIIVFFISFIGGAIIWIIKIFRHNVFKYKNSSTLICILLAGIIILFYSKLFNPQTNINKNASDYVSKPALKWYISKISDEYLPSNFVKPEIINDIANTKLSLISGNGKLLNEVVKADKQDFELIIEDKHALVLLKTAYFPAWNIYLNGMKSNFDISNNGLLLVVPEGRNKIILRFEETLIERVSNIISLSGIAVLLLGIIRSGQIMNNKQKVYKAENTKNIKKINNL